MDTPRLIPEATLAALWRIHIMTLQSWRRHGKACSSDEQAPSSRGKQQHYYLPSTIDAFHATRAVGFDDMPVPSAAALLRGNPGLYTIEETSDVFGKSKDIVYRWVRQRRIPAIQIAPTVIRFPAALVRTLAHEADGVVSQDVAAKILCISTHSVADLIAGHVLARVERREDIARNFITREDLLALLSQTIIGNITPEEWWMRCLNDDRPSTSISAASSQLHTTPEHLLGFLIKHQIPYLFTAGGHIKLPAWLMEEIIEVRRVLSDAELGAIFGVPAEVAASWIRNRQLCRHTNPVVPCPTVDCAIDYVTTHRTSLNLAPGDWLAYVLKDGMAPVGINELVETTPRSTHADIEAAIRRGELRGVWLPSGTHSLALLRNDAVVWRRKWTLYRS